MLGSIILVVVGLVICYGGAAELMLWVRGRARRRQATAVIIGLHEPTAVNPGGRGRAPVFRFTAHDGRVIDAVSSAWTFPEPTVGARVQVTYDPADPERSAERAGVRSLKLVLSPLLVAAGLAVAIAGVTRL